MGDLTAILTLDGSQCGERALQLVPLLAEMGIGRLRLVNVMETSRDASRPDAKVERTRNVILPYLEARADALRRRFDGLAVESVFRVGRVASQIIADEAECQADLIVLAAHGRTGWQRWRLGSISDEIIRKASVPVLLTGPNLVCKLPGYGPREIMVPLDALRLSHQALPAAERIAERTNANLYLVRVVTADSSLATTFEDTPASVLDRIEKEAREDLQRHAAEMGCDWSVVRAGFDADIANELRRYIAAYHVDLVVMTSRSRPSLERFLAGSMADGLVRGMAPVLLVKPGEIHMSRLLREPAMAFEREASA